MLRLQTDNILESGLLEPGPELLVCGVLRDCGDFHERRDWSRMGDGAMPDAVLGRIAYSQHRRHIHGSCKIGICLGGETGGAGRLPGGEIRGGCRRRGSEIESCS